MGPVGAVGVAGFADVADFSSLLGAQPDDHLVSGRDIAPEDIAAYFHTGGTTGVAKGAMLTHRNLVANMQPAASWVGTHVKLGEELILTALPLYRLALIHI